jgi:hypothetical protein
MMAEKDDVVGLKDDGNLDIVVHDEMGMGVG